MISPMWMMILNAVIGFGGVLASTGIINVLPGNAGVIAATLIAVLNTIGHALSPPTPGPLASK